MKNIIKLIFFTTILASCSQNPDPAAEKELQLVKREKELQLEKKEKDFDLKTKELDQRERELDMREKKFILDSTHSSKTR